jgi:hypothetical protein
MYPELKSPDIFYDLNNFTDVNIAGSTDKLLRNQKLYNEKAQKVFNIFDTYLVSAMSGIVE